MAGSLRFVDLVQDALDRFLSARSSELSAISPDLEDLASVSRDLLAGGKRFRALFCYWGWESIAALTDDPAESTIDAARLGPVTEVAAALEIFHAAALVHDDIMDASDTRRGGPSAHRRLEAIHRERALEGDAERHGLSAALLLGDLLLGWSDELLDAALEPHVTSGRAAAVRSEFVRMRTEVTAGQYLDVVEEGSWRSHADDEQLRRAHRVILYKSAKYSIEAPLAIGASLAGADGAQLTALRAFGVPLGVAFQLRDDLLGVFGDPEVTGKPAGDDLREGKRTVLIALARQKLPTNAARLLDELLGDRDLDAGQIRMLQNTISDSGAVDEIENLIARSVSTALESLNGARLSRSAHAELTRLADAVTRRVA